MEWSLRTVSVAWLVTWRQVWSNVSELASSVYFPWISSTSPPLLLDRSTAVTKCRSRSMLIAHGRSDGTGAVVDRDKTLRRLRSGERERAGEGPSTYSVTHVGRSGPGPSAG